ncbi:MAG: glutamate--tRNA ligase [Candidatus Omnitrophica bacterium]|nr:glutamate--tRNA ligase [Candidatus Omnitrophota bacterium]MBD3269324.1 glutamate--tRNA ligase [Candidatus Omnitrophota bacterium]
MDWSETRVRFAPSPTGYLHIGGARTALFNWIYAGSRAGKFILRIEDTDTERSKEEFLKEILESMEWLGMNWDEIYYQSARFDIYREYAQRLIGENKAYEKEGAIFFKYSFESIEVDDAVRGKISFRELPKAEEVIIKSNGTPGYNFSCVVDDALMNINCVIRGEDHLSNTPKQILMYRALGFDVPHFAHLPLILSPGGGRLSKRFGATSIREYRDLGYLPQALLNYFLLLGWSPGSNREIISVEEAKKIFDINQVNKTGAAFSLDKLNWLNAEYIRKISLEEFSDLIYNYLKEKACLSESADREYVKKVAEVFQTRIFKLSDLIEWSGFCFRDSIEYAEDTKKILSTDLSPQIKLLIERIKAIGDFEAGVIEKEFRRLAGDLGLKAKVLVHPVRVALTGRRIGPGLFETMELLGKQKVIARLEHLISYWAKKQ